MKKTQKDIIFNLSKRNKELEDYILDLEKQIQEEQEEQEEIERFKDLLEWEKENE